MLYDAAAGLYLTRTRAYNPKTGRFVQRDILDEDAKGGYKSFPFGKDAIGTNLYAWCNNNPVTREDPSGMWSFKGLGAKVGSYFGSVGAKIGAAVGSIVDYGVGYATGWAGGGGYSGYGYSGGGYGFRGNTSGRRARHTVKAATPVAPPEPAWKRNGPSASTKNKLKPASRPNSGFQHGQRTYIPSDPESFEGGKKIAEGIHWAHANVEAPIFMMTWPFTGFATGAALEIACAPSLVGIAACAPASGILIGGGAGLGYSEYRIWEGSDTHKAASWVWEKTPTVMSPAKMAWEFLQ